MSETVRVEFEKFSGFITEYASNISLGGMFIKTDQPRSIGSELRFEIVLSDGFRLVQGAGEVAWARSESQGPDKPAGMGIRFHDLDDSSRELIDKMVYHRLMDGGKPFELERSSEPATPATPEPAADLSPEMPTEPPAPAVPAPAVPPETPLPALETPSLESPAQAELPGMDSVPSFDLGGDSSFTSLENALDAEPSTLVEPPPGETRSSTEVQPPPELTMPSTQVQPPPDLAMPSTQVQPPPDLEPPVAAGRFRGFDSMPSTQVEPPPDLPAAEDREDPAATLHLPLDELPLPSASDAWGEESSLGGAQVPDSEPPPIGVPEGFGVAEISAPPSLPEIDEPLAPVELPGGFMEDPGPPPSPPRFEEPAGKDLDDSLLSMDDSFMRQAAPAVSPPSLEPPAPSFGAGPSLGSDPEPDWEEDEDLDEDDYGPPPRRSIGRLLLPVVLLILIAAAAFLLRDFWLPMIVGETAATDVVAAADESEDAAMALPSADGGDAEIPLAEEAEPTAESGADLPANLPDDPRLKVVPPPSETPAEPPPSEAASTAAMTGIDRITWRPNPEGLEVTLWADGRVSGASVTHHHLGGGNPRELLKVRGVSRPFAGGVLEVGDGRVVRIRSGYHENSGGNELHVVFDLVSDTTTVREIDTSGSKITLVLN